MLRHFLFPIISEILRFFIQGIGRDQCDWGFALQGDGSLFKCLKRRIVGSQSNPADDSFFENAADRLYCPFEIRIGQQCPRGPFNPEAMSATRVGSIGWSGDQKALLNAGCHTCCERRKLLVGELLPEAVKGHFYDLND